MQEESPEIACGGKDLACNFVVYGEAVGEEAWETHFRGGGNIYEKRMGSRLRRHWHLSTGAQYKRIGKGVDTHAKSDQMALEKRNAEPGGILQRPCLGGGGIETRVMKRGGLAIKNPLPGLVFEYAWKWGFTAAKKRRGKNRYQAFLPLKKVHCLVLAGQAARVQKRYS